jgi:hypothetical protein
LHSPVMTTNSQRPALERLIRVAHGDTGQSRIVANFLAGLVECRSGGFALTDMWAVDARSQWICCECSRWWPHASIIDTLGLRETV